ncbi:MAG: phage tail protein [Calditrichae bacterium]|nr:phage tail protein [Calditrichia bacterium]
MGWKGHSIPGINRIKGLRRTTNVTLYRQGNEKGVTKKLPGETAYAPIVLERGRTHDSSFERWAARVEGFGSSAAARPQTEFRKDIIIELLNEAGQVVMAWKVYSCWPTVYSPIETMDATSTETARESMVLEHNGWERDMSITEPVEPSYTVPH